MSRLAPILALALALTACRPAAIRPDLAADPAALLREVQATQAEVRSVSGNARVRIDSPDVKGTVNAFLAAEKPARLHIEILDFFGNPAAVMVADGARFSFYDARARTFYRGDATPENVSRFLPLVLPPEELATILCGSAPILPGEPLEVRERDGGASLVIGQGDLGQQLRVGSGLVVERSRVRRAGAAGEKEREVHYDLDFARFAQVGRISFPTELRLVSAEARSQVGLAWKPGFEVNPEVRPELFALGPPRGAKVVDLPAGAPVPDVELPLEPAGE